MKSLVLLAALSIASVASAQPIHGHPQLAAYTSLAQRRAVSFQGHWPSLDPTMTCHLHVDLNDFPYGAELASDLFDVHFTLKLFMCDGTIGAFWGDSFVATVWDATASTGGLTMPVLQGDPHGLKEWKGVVTIDPRKGRYAHPHGWTLVPFNARLTFTNGDGMDVAGFASFFSVIDRSAPEVPPPGGDGPVLSARVDAGAACRNVTPRPANCTSFGTMITEIDNWIPILPIATPWHTKIAVYNYTSNDPLPNGRFEQRFNIDLHAGVRGVLTDSGTADKQGFSGRDVVFDPAVMGPGPHNVAFFWTQTVAETVSALVVINVPVGTSVPPPLLCTDPTAPNVGGPAPCLPPIVVPVWAPITAFFERFGSEDRYRLCDAFHLSCRELVFK